MNFRPLILGALGNARVTLLEPGRYQFRFLLVDLLQRLLRCKSPALEILAHRSNRHIDLETTIDQAARVQSAKESLSCPALLADQLLHRPLLFHAECAPLTELRASFAAFDRRFEAFCLITRPSVLDRAGMHPDRFSNLGKFVAVYLHTKRYLALLLLVFWAELAGIFFIHSFIMT